MAEKKLKTNKEPSDTNSRTTGSVEKKRDTINKSIKNTMFSAHKGKPKNETAFCVAIQKKKELEDRERHMT